MTKQVHPLYDAALMLRHAANDLEIAADNMLVVEQNQGINTEIPRAEAVRRFRAMHTQIDAAIVRVRAFFDER